MDSLAEIFIDSCTIRYFDAPNGGRMIYQSSNIPLILKVYSSSITCSGSTYSASTVNSQVNSLSPASSTVFEMINGANSISLDA